MKTLYLITKGIKKLTDEEIRTLESENRHPRVSMLEDALHADVLDERYIEENVPFYRKWMYRYLPIEIAQVIEALIMHRHYDVIFTQSERVGLPLAFLCKYLRLRIPHVMIISRITSMYEQKSKKKKWLLKHTQDVIDKILIWSSVQRKLAIEELEVPSEKIRLVKRGTDQKFWHPIECETDMICTAGMEMRDYPTLVEALRPLQIPCHIAAGAARGMLFETVKMLHNIDKIPENITIGRKAYEELRAIYARSRFVVVSLLPTDSDNGLTAILEAMAMGKAVICSRVEGQVDVIQENETGIFVPQGNPVALRNAIIDLWNNPEKARKMGEAGRAYIEKHHTLEKFVDALATEVQDAAANAHILHDLEEINGLEELKTGT